MTATNSANIHVGTCAWAFEDWREVFYPDHLPAAERLAHYSRYFRAVEVDSTFYHCPQPHVTAHWAALTPPDFRFWCKVPREITHERRLADVAGPLDEFVRAMDPLGAKLGCLLAQLPPWLHPNQDEHALRDFIRALPGGFRWAVEFRGLKWHLPRIVHLLESRGVAWVWNDLTALSEADTAAFGFLPMTANFALVRLMGDLSTKYDAKGGSVHHYREAQWPRPQSLDNWAVKIRQTAGELSDVFVAVNNHFEGYAPYTAMQLATRLGMEMTLPDASEVHPDPDHGQMRLL